LIGGGRRWSQLWEPWPALGYPIGAPAVLGAVVISMNPVVTVLLAAMFLAESLTWTRVGALVLGVLAVLAACAGRLFAIGGVDTVVLLLLVALVSLAAGGVYQQRLCCSTRPCA
jgi:drug/metabolite transporter (DMT)-like permease